MNDLKTLVYVYGMVAAVMLAVFCGILVMKTLHETHITMPAHT